MKILKKLSLISLICVMCMLLGLVVYAGTPVKYLGTLSTDKLCVTGEEQEVTLALKLKSPQNIGSLDATITLPEGWSIVSITNEELGFTAGSYFPSTGKIVWYTDKYDAADYENVSLIAVIKVKVPADVIAGSYTIAVKDIEVTSNYGLDNLEVESTEVSKTVTIVQHEWQAPFYTWDNEYATCTAKRVCGTDGAHVETETVETTKTVKTPAGCETKGWSTYSANFDASWAVDGQTKDVEDIAAKNHAYPETPSSYTDNEDGTHTANYMCGNDENHVKQDEPVSHTYDREGNKCVCGAVKPVATAVKGDIDLDGDVDSDDLTLLARHVGGIEVITDSAVLANADVNGDDEVDSDDLTKHARYVGGIITDWSQE